MFCDLPQYLDAVQFDKEHFCALLWQGNEPERVYLLPVLGQDLHSDYREWNMIIFWDNQSAQADIPVVVGPQPQVVVGPPPTQPTVPDPPTPIIPPDEPDQPMPDAPDHEDEIPAQNNGSQPPPGSTDLPKSIKSSAIIHFYGKSVRSNVRIMDKPKHGKFHH